MDGSPADEPGAGGGRRSVTIAVPAKINLFLHIEQRRSDGYHELATVFHAIGLSDRLEIALEEPGGAGAGAGGAEDWGGAVGARLTIDGPAWARELPTGAGNLVLRADALMRVRHPELPATRYRLTKEIPPMAGLGGGSADAAGVLVGLNELGRLGYSRGELADMAASLGSDTSFCVVGGCAVGTGRGEQLTPLLSTLRAWVLIARPEVGISTAAAYAACVPRGKDDTALRAMMNALVAGDLAAVRARLANSFDTARLPGADQIREVKERLVFAGAVAPMLSGSGSAVFALFATEDEAAEVHTNLLRDGGPPLWTALSPLVTHGPVVIDRVSRGRE